MHSLKVDAEHFIDHHASTFCFRHNPFKYDVVGKDMKLDLDTELHLSPDMSTLRTCAWLKNEACVIANVNNADYSPRAVLKHTL